jgi:glycosyltransferase involved in cell wall biosynthesis
MKITIVTPAHNEQKRVSAFLSTLLKLKYSVVAVNDGSTDTTLRILNTFKNPKLTVLNHAINLGKGAALKTGCEYAFNNGAEAVILMDSDGQHLVSDIDKFIEKLESSKYDVVLGSRNYSLGVPLDRFLGNKIASVIIASIFGIYVSDLICGYRAITKKAFQRIKWESSDYGVEVETIIRIKKNNLKYCEVPVEAVYYDNFKGVSVVEAFGIFLKLFKWKFSI